METSELKQPNEAIPYFGYEQALGDAAPRAAGTTFFVEQQRRSAALPITPARRRLRRVSVLLRPFEDFAQAAQVGEALMDLRRENASSAAITKERAAALESALQFVKSGGKLGLRLSRYLGEARAEVLQFFPQLRDALQDVVLEAACPEDVWAIDDVLTDLERQLELPLGSVGIQVVLKSPAAVWDVERLATCTPRVSALQLAESLAAQLGWVFVPLANEDPTDAIVRRITEAEAAMRPALERTLLVARTWGIPLLRGPMPLEGDPTIPTRVASLLTWYDGIRVTSTQQAVELTEQLPPLWINRRLESFESYAHSRSSDDPAVAYRFDEDLHVLDEAMRQGVLDDAALPRYWRAKWHLLVDEGTPSTMALPEQTLPEAMLEAVRKSTHSNLQYRQERVAEDGSKRVFRSNVQLPQVLRRAANQTARALLDLGVGKGDRIALYCGNTLAHMAAFQGLSTLGAIAVPLDLTIAQQANRILNDAAVKVVLVDIEGQPDSRELRFGRLLQWAYQHGQDKNEGFWQELQQCNDKLDGEEAVPTLQHLQSLMPEELRHSFWEMWELRLDSSFKFTDALANVPSLQAVLLTSKEDFVPQETLPAMEERVAALSAQLGGNVRVAPLRELVAGLAEEDVKQEVSPDDPLVWIYSGTTAEGELLATYHTHRSLLALGLACRASLIPRGDWIRNVVASTAPFTQLGGLVCGFIAPVLGGCDTLVVPNVTENYLRSMASFVVSESATVLFSSPSAIVIMATNLPRLADLKNLRRIANLEAPLPPAVAELCQKHFSVTPCDGYGTAGNPLLLMNPSRANRVGTAGIPTPGLDARVVDASSGHVLPSGRVGVLEVRGPQVTPGVARPSNSKRPKVDGEAWWRTDARFTLDPDGYFVFCGRAR